MCAVEQNVVNIVLISGCFGLITLQICCAAVMKSEVLVQGGQLHSLEPHQNPDRARIFEFLPSQRLRR